MGEEERRFFQDVDPWGFILFQRHCETPDQVRKLTDDLRACVGRDDVPILIDEEGGRVQRLKPPHWRDFPCADVFRKLYENDGDAGLRAVRLNSQLLGARLRGLGINVDCLPVLDVPVPGSHDIIGDRAYGATPEQVSIMGKAAADGLLDTGVLPVIKHIPGHGRAEVDSHLSLPVVNTPYPVLAASDFRPFQDFRDYPLAMTAHVVYTAVDPEQPATTSPTVISKVIREEIGFDGLLMTDDLSMKALKGTLPDLAARALEAGCDVVLHCNGTFEDKQAVAAGCAALSGAAAERAARAEARLAVPSQTIDEAAVEQELCAAFDERGHAYDLA